MLTYRGKNKTRAELIKEQLELDKKKQKQKLIENTSFDLYPKESSYATRSIDKFRNEDAKRYKAYGNLQEAVLKNLFFNSIYKTMVEPVLEANYATDKEKALASTVVVDFINEQNLHDMLNQWKYKNIYLAEYAQNIQNTYNSIMEASRDKLKEGLSEKDVTQIENNKIDDFIYKSQNIIPADIGNKIVNRVEDAITDFSTDMKDNKEKVLDIYNKAQDKISSISGDEGLDNTEVQDMQQEAIRMAKRKELAITEGYTNVYGAMVKMLTESVMVIPVLHEAYTDDSGRIKVSRILSEAKAIYTVLETLNTVGIVEADEDYIVKTLNGMRSSLDEKKKQNPINDAERNIDPGDSYQPKEITHGNGESAKRDPTDDFAYNF